MSRYGRLVASANRPRHWPVGSCARVLHGIERGRRCAIRSRHCPAKGGVRVASEHELPLEEYHRAGLEILNGNPEGYKPLYSRRDDVTLANPFGPPVRGWSQVSATLDRAAENYRDGEVVGFENVSTVIGTDLAYTVEVESYRGRVGGAQEMSPVAVRVSTAFRREDGIWQVV